MDHKPGIGPELVGYWMYERERARSGCLVLSLLGCRNRRPERIGWEIGLHLCVFILNCSARVGCLTVLEQCRPHKYEYSAWYAAKAGLGESASFKPMIQLKHGGLHYIDA